jgi:hypothetical protein
MNRRNFLSALVGGVATAAAVQTFPFRVFSFPSEVEKVSPALIRLDMRALTVTYYDKDAIEMLKRSMSVEEISRWQSLPISAVTYRGSLP